MTWHHHLLIASWGEGVKLNPLWPLGTQMWYSDGIKMDDIIHKFKKWLVGNNILFFLFFHPFACVIFEFHFFSFCIFYFFLLLWMLLFNFLFRKKINSTFTTHISCHSLPLKIPLFLLLFLLLLQIYTNSIKMGSFTYLL